MRSPLAYRRPRGPLGETSALAAAAYFTSFAVVAFAFDNPIVLLGAAAAVVVAAHGAGAGRALRLALRWGLALAAVFVLVNAIVAQRGDTILVRGFELAPLGQVAISAEALVEGSVLALRVLVVMMAFAVQSASVDPDRLLLLVRPLAGRSALTATLIARLVPLAASDYGRLREAVELRGPAAAPVGRAATARRLVAGSLDRAVDVAATLELRGFAHGPPRSARSGERPRHSALFWVAAITIACGSLATRLAGIGAFDAYPLVSMDVDAATVGLALALPLCAAAPFVLPRVAEARRRAVARPRRTSLPAAEAEGGRA